MLKLRTSRKVSETDLSQMSHCNVASSPVPLLFQILLSTSRPSLTLGYQLTDVTSSTHIHQRTRLARGFFTLQVGELEHCLLFSMMGMLPSAERITLDHTSIQV